ncbi:flagellar biosynthetic protein FlhB [Jatrophihabitans sp. GAS493]|uniref:EscU/YscU/HrcU family type III secretion system export apparatus switch protein n=1 Tax=Jatrophihabitans sp. GAS493 TaxID=1907575 RepID=UPI000BB7EC2A|nr:EscU/YscU/HrcU family type III secretion system export apparatus switch protein [Jatrophihabitans sp. GAS493]SOD71316.1 flagellar biosynthetic protein FlhB [Jatrophihabitans sp. GAS493]
MAEKPTEERTEQATPKQKKKARREGQIGNTPEFGSWVGLLVASFVLPHVAESLMNTCKIALLQSTEVIQNPQVSQVLGIARNTAQRGMLAVLPLALVFIVVSIISVGAQGGIYFSPKALAPKFSRMNPLSGVKRMFGPHGWWAALKALLKTTVVGVVVYMSVRNLIPTLIGAGALSLDTLVSTAISMALRVMRVAAAAGILMAIADYVVVRRRNNKSLKMTKQQVKEENKSSDGNPQLKGAIRSKQISMSRNRMMADVPTADVVIVNPTHIAVALKYDAEKGAPRVVAMGGDYVAARIRELAEKHRIPMVADIPLARTLYQTCTIGGEIPPDLYKAVATVLAFIMTLKRRGSAAGTHTVRPLAPAR